MTPRYIGTYLDTLPSSGINANDWALRYSTTAANRGVYIYTFDESDPPVGSWGVLANPTTAQLMALWADLCTISNNALYVTTLGDISEYIGTSVNFIEVLGANIAFINQLFANYIKVQTGGSIRGGYRYDVDGADDDPDATGFWLGADGTLKGRDCYFEEGNFSGGVISSDNKLKVSSNVLGAYDGILASTGNIDSPVDGDRIVLLTSDSGVAGLRFYKRVSGDWTNIGSLVSDSLGLFNGISINYGSNYFYLTSTSLETRGTFTPLGGLVYRTVNPFYTSHTYDWYFDQLESLGIFTEDFPRLCTGIYNGGLYSSGVIKQDSNTYIANGFTITNGGTTSLTMSLFII